MEQSRQALVRHVTRRPSFEPAICPLIFSTSTTIIRQQQRHGPLVAHDGSQHYPAPGDGRPSLALPGDGIRFEQTYWHYFLGLRMAYELGRHLKEASRVKLFMQFDWAYVDGNNEDRHLLRVGDRRTYENTRGDAWHALLGLNVGITDSINLNLAVDYLKIQSTGSHRLVNHAFDIDFTFDHGVKVWSQQTSINVNVEYLF
jgi:hypothetical protein